MTALMASEKAEPAGTGWRSWHLHLATFAPPALDSAILHVLGPLAEPLGLLGTDGPAWFFLRYWQGGPHLRLRINGLSQAEATALEAALTERLHTLDAGVPPSQRLDQAGYARTVQSVAAAGERGAALEIGELLAPGLHRAIYEPEYDRYGGRHLMATSENLFHRSSRLALRVCLARAGTRHAFGSGLEASAAACSVLDGGRPESIVPVLRAQQDFWTGFAGSGQAPEQLGAKARDQVAALGPLAPRLRQAMRHGDPRWAEWTDALGAALQEWTARLGVKPATWIFGSHLHLTANRLGVGVEREAQIAALLLAVLDSGSEPAASAVTAEPRATGPGSGPAGPP